MNRKYVVGRVPSAEWVVRHSGKRSFLWIPPRSQLRTASANLPTYAGSRMRACLRRLYHANNKLKTSRRQL